MEVTPSATTDYTLQIIFAKTFGGNITAPGLYWLAKFFHPLQEMWYSYSAQSFWVVVEKDEWPHRAQDSGDQGRHILSGLGNN